MLNVETSQIRLKESLKKAKQLLANIKFQEESENPTIDDIKDNIDKVERLLKEIESRTNELKILSKNKAKKPDDVTIQEKLSTINVLTKEAIESANKAIKLSEQLQYIRYSKYNKPSTVEKDDLDFQFEKALSFQKKKIRSDRVKIINSEENKGKTEKESFEAIKKQEENFAKSTTPEMLSSKMRSLAAKELLLKDTKFEKDTKDPLRFSLITDGKHKLNIEKNNEDNKLLISATIEDDNSYDSLIAHILLAAKKDNDKKELTIENLKESFPDPEKALDFVRRFIMLSKPRGINLKIKPYNQVPGQLNVPLPALEIITELEKVNKIFKK